MAAAVLACTAAASALPARGEDCGGGTLGTGIVRAITDSRTLLMEDGRSVHLQGVEVPATLPETTGDQPSPEALARSFLQARAVGRTVTLKGQSSAPDRYDRVPAYVLIADEGLEGLLQRAMVLGGVARVADRVGERSCAAALLASERRARAARLGLWADPNYAVLQADDLAAVRVRRGRLALVEGRVLSVRESGGTIYVNFGRRWSEDFTVTVAKRNERSLTAGGLDVRRLERRVVRVRGWVEERGGPWIEVTRPEQIEVVRN